MYENGEVNHFEFLADSLELPVKMLDGMYGATNGNTGTFISWHASFEISKNKELINQVPQYKSYLEYINSNTYDLEKLFFTEYVDYRFLGKTSIKYILPVMVPNLNYQNLEVKDGTMALDTWGRMILDEEFNEDVNKTRSDLLSYCELDTLAMLEIYRKLISIIA